MLSLAITYEGILMAMAQTIGERLEQDPFWWALGLLATGATAGATGAWWLSGKLNERPSPKSWRQESREMPEEAWLERVSSYVPKAQSLFVYLRYYRDPDYGADPRMEGKQRYIRDIMNAFAKAIVDHRDAISIVAFRKRSWTDDPNQWLANAVAGYGKMTQQEARDLVERCVLTIHDEPATNSSTLYLLDKRYLFYNCVTGSIGSERKEYHHADLTNSVIPLFLENGMLTSFGRAGPTEAA